MLLSIYTFVRNGLFYDFHVVEMLKHHLPLADEIIVNEGYSTDGTYEAISNLDPKIKIFRSPWGQPKDLGWFAAFKNDARKRCSGKWCLLLDCDEFIPEWEFDSIRTYLATAQELLIPLKIINFYGNYRVFHARPRSIGWAARDMRIHQNVPEIEVWGDGANVGVRGEKVDWNSSPAEFTCHHFGFVRSAARLREKWRNLQGDLHTGRRKRFRIPSFLFNLFPHNWKDPSLLSDLELYPGPHVKAVRDNPAEFTRDGGVLTEYLERQSRAKQVAPAI